MKAYFHDEKSHQISFRDAIYHDHSMSQPARWPTFISSAKFGHGKWFPTGRNLIRYLVQQSTMIPIGHLQLWCFILYQLHWTLESTHKLYKISLQMPFRLTVRPRPWCIKFHLMHSWSISWDHWPIRKHFRFMKKMEISYKMSSSCRPNCYVFGTTGKLFEIGSSPVLGHSRGME